MDIKFNDVHHEHDQHHEYGRLHDDAIHWYHYRIQTYGVQHDDLLPRYDRYDCQRHCDQVQLRLRGFRRDGRKPPSSLLQGKRSKIVIKRMQL